jgi:hypothetical protein
MNNWVRGFLTQINYLRKSLMQFGKASKASLMYEISLFDWGSDELFIGDINNDGQVEFLWLQSQGIFKSDIYLQLAYSKYSFLKDGRGLDCVTVTDRFGEIIWRLGKPHKGRYPFCSHAAEKMVAFYQTNDGKTKIAMLASGEKLRLIDGMSGVIERELTLQHDNYSSIDVVSTKSGRFFYISVMDAAYSPFEYGNPTLIFDANLELLNTINALGSGHQTWVHDFDHDGNEEIMIGYQIYKANGDLLWGLDYWKGKEKEYIASDQHVDCISPLAIGGKWFAAIAGSDRLYWVDEDAHVLWHHVPRHAQYALAGRFNGQHADDVLVLVDSKHGTKLCGFSLKGKKLWELVDVSNWPMGKPAFIGRKPYHLNVPAIKWNSPDQRSDEFIFLEGGWPYAINGEGAVSVIFPYPKSAQKIKNNELPQHRPNDLGYGYQARCADVDNDGEEEVIIFDRRHAWIYKMPKSR